MSKTLIRSDERGLRCQANGSTVRPVTTYPMDRIAWSDQARRHEEARLAVRHKKTVRFEIDGDSDFKTGDRVTANHINGSTMAHVYTQDHLEIWWIDYERES